MVSIALKIVCITFVFQGCTCAPIIGDAGTPEPKDVGTSEKVEMSGGYAESYADAEGTKKEEVADVVPTAQLEAGSEISQPLKETEEKEETIDAEAMAAAGAQELQSTIKEAREQSKQFADAATKSLNESQVEHMNYNIAADLSDLQEKIEESKDSNAH